MDVDEEEEHENIPESPIMPPNALNDVLETSFRRFQQPNGCIPTIRLLDMFQDMGLDCREDDLDDLLRAAGEPEAEELDLEQCMRIYEIFSEIFGGQERQSMVILLPNSDQYIASSNARITGWRRIPAALGRLFSYSERTALKGTPLLIAVVVMITITACGLAGTAIGLQWRQTMLAEEIHLADIRNLVVDVMGALHEQIEAEQIKSLEDKGEIIASFTESMGWDMSLNTALVQLQTGVSNVARVITGVTYKNLLERERAGLMSAVDMIATLINSTMVGDQADTQRAIRMIQRLNERFSGEYQVVLSGWVNAQAVVLSSHAGSAETRRSVCSGVFCSNLTGSLDTTDPSEMPRRALSVESGSLYGVDPDGLPVMAAHQWLRGGEFGVTYMASLHYIRNVTVTSLIAVLDELNSENTDSLELVLGAEDESAPLGFRFLTSLRFAEQCAASVDGARRCDVTAGSAEDVQRAVSGEIGASVLNDYRPKPVLAAYAPIPSLNLGIVLKLDREEFTEYAVHSIGETLNKLNNISLKGSLEVVMGRVLRNDTSRKYATGSKHVVEDLEILTEYQFGGDCNGKCDRNPLAAVPMRLAAQMKEAGVQSEVPDYRDASVVVSYEHIASLDVGLTVKIDYGEVDGGVHAQGIAVLDTFNAGGTKLGVHWAEPDADGSVTYRTEFGLCEDCVIAEDTFKIAREASAGGEGIERTIDAKGNDVLAAYGPTGTHSIGIVVAADYAKVIAPLRALVIKLVICSIAFTAFGVGVTFFVAYRMLRRMRNTWKSKLQLEARVTKIEELLSNMYPKAIAARMLRGDQRIVEFLPYIACVMIDIHHFTYVTNCISAEELLELLGYTFHVMDTIADYYGVYKVKTIGDCFLGLAGLPDFFQYTEDPAVHAVHFASGVLQNSSEKASSEKAASVASGSTSSSAAERKAAATKTYCMRIGMACGPATVGILPGKTPVFDCWGPTINLAARMESSGAPSYVQCSEEIYKRSQQLPSFPYIWDRPRTVYAKGFGNVLSYFISKTSLALPKALINELGLDIKFKDFVFGGVTSAAPTKSLKEIDSRSAVSK
eukprot:NODE_35_length_4113_cov_30.974163_g26_i1.p1 GENE.NODE_35_length_4113_cov_30.974163_g26_i1~~NODE_35_length_4113_cov_30.974163_g26_i1.p1  ORF type:complete len:1118 (+),score=265.67 NODE_35_length_4113_cov_30.974163_g26_i1:159-3356(+)